MQAHPNAEAPPPWVVPHTYANTAPHTSNVLVLGMAKERFFKLYIRYLLDFIHLCV